ncbi:bifunctional diaminohydroxyphosphoribosylaminopyrimidine deaminase/5-amino-6-(5-phosphoribosylamino)uracil reductase RibD [Helicobacter sp. faydin-H20]|uniref:bifunctional diaminohydroxyphosphoribosylaminopyrimidine deaminase/5-amino-6-(5-phosphoribosylamino)uracil reductase RibD n=1 Tax=Helicobacter anatolicus TaxID=2905874 RepID=UPI001E5B2724|nr:bifunctional diaminohydroxyphosphoribosylaminopyrimidine deaminase/5-amino-6-(5-phosphoribosylamino)uracil reductase RibD [Helicobacter anatolicus]MCE3036849.1 bifunctional diaminohydroxyphosphoribosylaminopyrimidine deaminase/5-amino-6-(5-phosphoribosylamino)uracil reductase RibD [Helicobacter anatolicus]
MLHDKLLMSLCINKAWESQTLTLPNPAVAAMVVDQNGQILSLASHQKSGLPHAEVLALKEAYFTLTNDERIQKITDSKALHDFLSTNHNKIFHNCSIYVTLEPCTHYGKTPPCAMLLKTLSPKRVIIGALEHTHNKGGKEILKAQNIEVVSEICKEQCQDLLFPFIRYQNQKKFNLFKIAQRLNGDYKSGAISSHEARIFTHKQRSISNQILISQNTLIADDPLLDSRFATEPFLQKQPCIGILTKNKDSLAKTYKIFENKREVLLHTHTPILQEGFNIIEGGWKLFQSFKEQIDLLLVHISPTLRENANQYGFNYNGKILHHQRIGEDVILWIKNS